jgi:hypothetical protein
MKRYSMVMGPSVTLVLRVSTLLPGLDYHRADAQQPHRREHA